MSGKKALDDVEKPSVDISVVIPVYGCPGALPELHRRLVEALEGMDKTFEIILVDDHDPYNSWEGVEKLCAEDSRVVGVSLSRNFGQIRAITAGLDQARGDWVVVMDCDLQDRPEAIPLLYAKAQEGYDAVFAKRQDRKDTGLVKFLSKSFYKVYDFFTDGNFDSSIGNFSICRRQVISNYCKMREKNRAFTLFIRWLGFKQTAIEVPGDARFEGKSSYNFSRKIRMAFEFITSQSNKPLLFSVMAGFVIALIAFVVVLYLVIRSFVVGGTPAGWTSMIASIYLMGGLILMAVGICGVYIGNVFDEVKDRPLYVVREVLNGKDEVR